MEIAMDGMAFHVLSRNSTTPVTSLPGFRRKLVVFSEMAANTAHTVDGRGILLFAGEV